MRRPGTSDDGRRGSRGRGDAPSRPGLSDGIWSVYCAPRRLRRAAGIRRRARRTNVGSFGRRAFRSLVRSAGLADVLRTLQAVLGFHLLVGLATAHGGGTSDEGAHLVVDAIGLVAIAFLAYLAYVFARDVLYRRLRAAFDR